MSLMLDEISEVIGREKAARLCQVYGGVRHYIPMKATPGHKFAVLLGLEAWRAFCRAFGGGAMDLPRGENAAKKRRVKKLLRTTDLPHRQIALDVGCTERFVRIVAGQLRRSDDRQPGLFG